ncbi:hypothetical protein GYMLUDRAFT_43568 [Collybiopsis luxurians FD-317 M1]|uniref:HCP-like protein n=1 Tax=Collybiopsis luxurians FD-317 M1 TaxID=944289 RepID=A0A0D0CW25_9AGAR|nr:hypothetical protein GYMLUDRAFT_43568 [Collybiopsis luxurians FD-317 M1]
MARNLDEQLYTQQQFRGPSPAHSRMSPSHSPLPPPPPTGPGYAGSGSFNNAYNPGGFNIPGAPPPPARSPHFPPQPQWTPWSPALPTPPHSTAYSPAPALPYPSGSPSLSASPAMHHRVVSPAPTISAHIHHPAPSSSSLSIDNSSPPSLTAPLPTIPALTQAMPTIQNPQHDPALRVAWVRDVFFLVEKAHALASGTPFGEPPNGPVVIMDEGLLKLTQVAVPIILSIAGTAAQGSNSLPAYVAEALYHRASLTASGSFPEHIQKNPRQAFRDFEQAARAGYGKAWFRIGRDYEGFGDVAHAKECFERGVRAGVASCLYRLGMAQLLGQLNLPPSPETALPLLHRAAVLSSIDTPQPAYVYALLLLGEFTQAKIDQALFFRLGLIPGQWAHSGNVGLLQEARTHLEKSAHLHFAPAQYKLGHAYEFATPPWEFDALMSVEWYSRASQQGETEADMALSKWFLCGSRVGGGGGGDTDPSLGGFDKDEQLARVFAEKAARKGLSSAEFAMGYYCEVGIGGVKDLDEALAWYSKASEHGNTDASERLAALRQPAPQMLSRQEHDNITESKLVRSRTQAKQRSEAQKVRDGYLANQQTVQGPPPASQPQGLHPRGRTQDSRPVVDLIRKTTLNSQGGAHGRYHAEHANSLPPLGRPEPSINRTASAQGGPRPGNQPQAFPGANRYTLVDPGSGSVPPAPPRSDSRPLPRRGPSGGVSVTGGIGSGTPSPAAGTPSAGGYGPSGPSGVPPPAPPKPAGPQTFAEMGFQGAKAEEEKCLIM